MTFQRRLAAIALSAALVTGSVAVALGDPPARNEQAGGHEVYRADAGAARDGGTMNVTVVGVDYASGRIFVAGPRGRMAIQVLPSTSIFSHGNGYATLTDLRPGAHVQVYVSRVGGRLVAQIIRIQ